MSANDDQYLYNAIVRIAEMERRAVPETKAVGAYPFFSYAQMPYWINYLAALNPTTAPNELTTRLEATWKMRLVIGHKTEGFDGTLTDKLYIWIPQVIEYFQARKHLQYEGNQSALRYLDPRGVRINLARFGVFQADKDVNHVGAEFDLVLQFVRQITPAYQ